MRAQLHNYARQNGLNIDCCRVNATPIASWGHTGQQIRPRKRWFDEDNNAAETFLPGIVSDDAAVFWMKPDAGPRAAERRSVTVAQLTMVNYSSIAIDTVATHHR